MPKIHDYLDHSLIADIYDAVSPIVRMLYKHDYSTKSLYVAQECLLDEIISLEQSAREWKDKAQDLRKQAAGLAVDSMNRDGQITESVKNETKALYQEADEYDKSRQVLQYGRRLLRYVGDGIAWHAYRHNRSIIRTLASKEPVPAVADMDGMIYVRRIFRTVRRLSRDRLPVLHKLSKNRGSVHFSRRDPRKDSGAQD